MAEPPEDLLRLIEDLDWAYVATASEDGQPDLAVERDPTVDGRPRYSASGFNPSKSSSRCRNGLVLGTRISRPNSLERPLAAPGCRLYFLFRPL